jgi:uncharacterized protein YutE (UPF0331/DUF86 family)
VRERRFVEHTLQIAIQVALDVASHIVSDRRLGEPATNRELFDLLAADAWIDTSLTASLRRMVGMRNVLVHGYTKVDAAQLRRAVTDNLGDLLAVSRATGRVPALEVLGASLALRRRHVAAAGSREL